MFGRFLELGIATPDIAASVQFYERLGFTQLLTGDAWPHRYGVLSDGRLHLGLHEREMPSPALCFTLPELARARASLATLNIEPELERLDDEHLHELRLRDPAGQAITLLEARTFSPAPPGSTPESLCGYFLHLSLPQPDFKSARRFWERAGLVALPQVKQPYPHVPLTSDTLDLAFHRPSLSKAALLVFDCEQLPRQRARLAELNIAPSSKPPHGPERTSSVLIEAPEGTLIWLLGPEPEARGH
jgi:catechol 2,3-dioxygenase-like lactoylglutathione lyase family enzyme